MKEIAVHIPPDCAGQKLSDALRERGFALAQPCGGRGTCGKCRVRTADGQTVPACRTLCPPEGVTVFVPAVAAAVQPTETKCVGEGVPVPPILPENPTNDCRNIDTNGDKNEKTPSSTLTFRWVTDDSAIPLTTSSNSHEQDDEQTLAGTPAKAGEGSAEVQSACGIALDIGTTTLAAALVAPDGRYLRTSTRLNPQQAFGADVMTRITACREGHLQEMRRVLLAAVSDMVADLTQKEAVPSALFVAGNPTMLHIFCGLSPEGMGTHPFTPVFLDTKVLCGAELHLPFERVTVLPSASAFVGSDILCGLEIARAEQEPPSLLVDIGTNGEMILASGTRLTATSVAAGPALEGAGISCGTGGIPGAVCRVFRRQGRLVFRTVADAPPIGLCGSGLVDLVAYLLDAGILDEMGYLEQDFRLVGLHETADGKHLSEGDTGLRLTREDVRAFQLAKSAVCAGMLALLAEEGLSADEVRRVYVAGGLGYFLHPYSCVRCGLLPVAFLDKMAPVGNAALAGAALCAADPATVPRLDDAAARCHTLALNQSENFSALFMQHLAFPRDLPED